MSGELINENKKNLQTETTEKIDKYILDTMQIVSKNNKKQDRINPSNLKTEKTKFFEALNEGREYNPVFEYSKTGKDYSINEIQKHIKEYKAELKHSELNIDVKRIYNEVLELFRKKIKKYDLLGKEGSEEEYYNLEISDEKLPNEKIVAEAKTLLMEISQKPQQEEENIVSSEQLKEYFEDLLKKAGIPEEAVEIRIDSSLIARASVTKEAENIVLKIKEGEMFSKKAVDKLTVHELGTHVFRSYNGGKQQFKIFSKYLPGYASTEEGLAVYNEYINDALSDHWKQTYLARLVAVDYAIKQGKSFYETFKLLTAGYGLDEERAFSIVSRVKRVLMDTSKPGGSSKDFQYWQGFVNVKNHLEKYPEDYKILYLGKFGLHHLKTIKRMVREGLLDGNLNLITSKTVEPKKLDNEELS